jgi:integrase
MSYAELQVTTHYSARRVVAFGGSTRHHGARHRGSQFAEIGRAHEAAKATGVRRRFHQIGRDWDALLVPRGAGARTIERAAAAAGLELKAHPHILRHACGYALANKGHDTRAIQGWLGHWSITSTAVYTALVPNRFKDFWRD